MLFFILTLFISFTTHAGVMELGASYSVRNSSIDNDNFTENESWTGSYAWYFFEMSALELSYTKGLAKQSLKAAADPAATLYYADFEMAGADLVLTLAGKDSFLQPFIRGGFAKLKKKFYKEDKATNQITPYGDPVDQVVPSYGAGIKIKITQSFSIKGSYDRWRSGTKGEEIWDDAIKGGISWYF